MAAALVSSAASVGWVGCESALKKKKNPGELPAGSLKVSLNFYEERSFVVDGAFVCPGEEFEE